MGGFSLGGKGVLRGPWGWGFEGAPAGTSPEPAPPCSRSLKVEYDKLANEKTEMQRHYVMVSGQQGGRLTSDPRGASLVLLSAAAPLVPRKGWPVKAPKERERERGSGQEHATILCYLCTL